MGRCPWSGSNYTFFSWEQFDSALVIVPRENNVVFALWQSISLRGHGNKCVSHIKVAGNSTAYPATPVSPQPLRPPSRQKITFKTDFNVLLFKCAIWNALSPQ